MGKQGELLLTDGDLEVFRWLWMVRIMTLEQIRRVRYYQSETGRLSALDNARKRLKRLWDQGYLQGDLLSATKERLYFLGEKALPALRARFGIEQQRLYRPRFDSEMQILHPLLVSECAVRIVESLRGSELELLDLPPLWIPFIHTHAVGNASKKKHIERFVSQEDIPLAGRLQPLRIRPDLVFSLARGAFTRLYFLEADRGSESPQVIGEKLLAYHHYSEALDPQNPHRYLWQRYGVQRDFRVLLVTTDDRRVAHLARVLSEQPGFELVALTTVEAFKGQNVLFEPIWTNQHGRDRALAKR